MTEFMAFTCISCKDTVEGNFCPSCGAQRPKQCPGCQAMVRPIDKFCHSCGCALQVHCILAECEAWWHRHGRDAKGQHLSRGTTVPPSRTKKNFRPLAVDQQCRQFPPKTPKQCVHPEVLPLCTPHALRASEGEKRFRFTYTLFEGRQEHSGPRGLHATTVSSTLKTSSEGVDGCSCPHHLPRRPYPCDRKEATALTAQGRLSARWEREVVCWAMQIQLRMARPFILESHKVRSR